MSRTALVLPALLLLSGCAGGFNRAALSARMQDDSLQVTDEAILEAQSVKPQLRLPCRMAVYLKPSSQGAWRWSAKDRAALESWAATLKDQGIAADAFLLPEMIVSRGELKEVRLAAARCGADALLVIQGAAETDSYLNPAAVLNLTVVGGYLVPGSHRDALFVIEGCLFDTGNGYLYAGAQAEGEGGIIRPTFIIEERDAVALAKAQALERFGPALLQRLRGLTDR
jgi:hypothetical protein